MRVPTASFVLALPILGVAAEEAGPFQQYRAQFQNFIGSLIPSAAPAASGEAAASSGVSAAAAASSSVKSADVDPEASTVSARPTVELTLNGWQDTLYSVVKPDATTPAEWWVLVTGGNKTCFGHCGAVESAFNQTAPKISSVVDGPNTAILNCENQPVLCHSWFVSPPYLYVFEILPKPAKTDIYAKRLNMTTTTAETISELYESKSKESFELLEGHLHPVDGTVAVNGLAVPMGYVLWFFSVVPSWAMMVGISFLSRTIMGRRMGPEPQRGARGPAGNFPRAQ